MIKLPKEVNNIMKTLEKAGFETYVVGGCVRDSIIGLNPYDWDMATAARLDDIKNLFPDAKVLSEKLSVVRFDFTHEVADENDDSITVEGIMVDLATFRIEGKYSDYRRPDDVEFTDSIAEDLKRRDFTINAMADNPERNFVDSFNGREDIKLKLIRSIGNPSERFKEDPLRMLRAVRFAAELNFDLSKSVYEAIVENWRLLENSSIDKIRKELENLLVANFAGKGLNMMADTGLMAVIVGEDVSRKMSTREMQNFTTLCENIDKTKPIITRRLGLLYTCFDEKRGLEAIEKMNFDSETHQHLVDAMKEMTKIYFIADGKDLKLYLVEHGMDRYNYIHNLSKAQSIVYDQWDSKIKNRMYLLNEIHKKGEAIFVEDLAIDANDLIEAGIATNENAGQILLMLTDVVHKKPVLNTRKDLLIYAKKFSKNKLMASLRRVNWIK